MAEIERLKDCLREIDHEISLIEMSFPFLKTQKKYVVELKKADTLHRYKKLLEYILTGEGSPPYPSA